MQGQSALIGSVGSTLGVGRPWATAVEVAASPEAPPLDVGRLREDFPALDQRIGDHQLIYLDSAATAQTPRQVVEAVRGFDLRDRSNVHRGVHALSQRATEAYEEARRLLGRLINASSASEVVFCRGTTEAINLVASSYGGQVLGPGDEVLLTQMEHHSNIVPWQLACERTGATLRVVPIDDRGQLRLDAFERLLSERTRIVALAHVSNALGTINPVEAICRRAHEVGAAVLVDGAQAVPHLRVDVQRIGCDFYAFSGHKVYGPTGIGVLYGRRELLERMAPYQGGGDMIRRVSFERTTYAPPPQKFEAGTTNIAGAIGLGAAAAYVEEVGLDRIQRYENELLAYATSALSAVEGLSLVGTAPCKAGVLSFVLEGVHPHDIGTILDAEGIAIRAGHHCAQPLMKRLGVAATARASLAFYNTTEEIDALVRGLSGVREMFG